MWADFFYNAPLRTFIELYIEISLGFFMHTLNIRFLTPSGIVITVLMFLGGLYVVFFPFLLLNLLSRPYHHVKGKTFNNKFGTMTEDVFKKRTMYQKSYSVLFVFNRLILTGTLVYMYYQPFYQMLIIMATQIFMISYMMKYRPFKSELHQVIAVSDEFILVF